MADNAPQVPDLTAEVADVHSAVNALTTATESNPDAAVGAIQPIVNIVSKLAGWLQAAYAKANAGTPDDPSKT